MTKKISTIIFDFGNVLLNLDITTSIQRMEALLGLSYDVYHEQMPDCFRAFETGAITETQFVEELRQLSGQSFSVEAFRSAWNSLLLDVPTESMKMLKTLKLKYRLFLLSNTNETHLAGVELNMGSSKFFEFEQQFEHCFYSCRMGDRKPNLSIFETVINQTGCIPNETLFIDDGLMHIEGARQAGIKALHLSVNDTIIQLLDRHQLL